MAKQPSFIVNFQYTILLGLVKFLAFIPVRLYAFLAEFLLCVLRSAFKKDLKKIAVNAKYIFGLEAHSNFVKVFQKQVLTHQIVSNLEGIKQLVKPELDVEILGLDTLEGNLNSIDESNGVICITGHLGNWELCGKCIKQVTDKSFNALAKAPKNLAAVKLLSKLRSSSNVDLLWTNRSDLFEAMENVLDSGNFLGFVMDQKPGKRKGVMVDFLGKQTEYVTGPAKFAISKNTPVVGVFCLREGPLRYRVISKVLMQKDHGIEDQQHATQIMANEIERVIKLYPEQWVWNYKRWKISY